MSTLAEWIDENDLECNSSMLAVAKTIWVLGKNGVKVSESDILETVKKQKISAEIVMKTIKRLLQRGKIYDPENNQNYRITPIWKENEKKVDMYGMKIKIQEPTDNKRGKYLLVVHFKISSNFWLHDNSEDNMALDLLKLVVKPDIIEQFKNDLRLSWTPRLDELKALNRVMEKVRKMNKEI